MKSVIEKPAYSKWRNRPMRIPMAIDIMPIASIFSSFSGIWFTFLRVFSIVVRGVILNRNKYVARVLGIGLKVDACI